MYVSDHGESLGEKGLWLHGAPYFIAPSEQIEAPMVLWMNEDARKRFGVDMQKLKSHADIKITHDWLADTLFTFTEVSTRLYHRQTDLIDLGR